MMTGLPDVQVQNAQPRVEITWPRPDVALFVLEGEHDLESAPRLERAMGDALLTCSGLLVDLSSVEFIDSSTIHVLVRMKKEADSQGSSFGLVLDGSPNIERTLEICGVLGALNRVASVDAALRNGNSPANPGHGSTAFHPQTQAEASKPAGTLLGRTTR
jgi:anti-anti-sigma factor